ncbi:MAG: ribonuclease E [Planctomycetota bacterium]|nr:MAG: ribonuclease E [Planctomycetota bacterium]
MKRTMLINVVEPEEGRVAILKDGVLDELYIERTQKQTYLGNIYKARVVNVEPAIQAAFVEFGGDKQGFLHVSDVLPDIGKGGGRTPKKRGRHRLIQNVLRRGQELLVQVTRDGVGHKGPTLSTFVSIPGRYLVLMPQLKRLGVSKKIEEPEQRDKLRKMLESLHPPKDLGFIVRTAGAGKTKRELQKDLQYLMRLWKAIQLRTKKSTAPAALYKESDLVIRTIRDLYTPEIKEIVLDHEDECKKAREFLRSIMPRGKHILKFHDSAEPIFYKYGVEEQIEGLYRRKVPLKSGGSLVIEQTEAMVSVDVNSGGYRREKDLEETALKINLEAAREIARQLRLRDLGGVVVIDFIDMRSMKHRQAVEREFRAAVKDDRAQKTVLKMSRFCLIEMTRQKMRPGMHRDAYEECPLCHGSGSVKTVASVSLEVMRKIKLGLREPEIKNIEVTVSPQVAFYLQNTKRKDLVYIEDTYGKAIYIRSDEDFQTEDNKVVYHTKNGEKKP